MKRFVLLAAVAFLFGILPGCGDVFRPIIIPNPPTFPNPAAAHTVVTLSDNGTTVNGSVFVIDVSGDTDVSIKDVGLRPVHMVQQTATQILAVNQSVLNAPADAVSKLTFSGVTIGSTITITLPASYDPAGSGTPMSSLPNFVASTESGQAYISLPNYQPVQKGGPIVPSVTVINTLSNNVVATFQVSSNPTANPVAVVETLDAKKLYVANNGDNAVVGFNTQDRSPRTITGTFNAPIWFAARNDSQRVYVLNGNGVISTMDTSTTAGPDNVIDASISVPGANYMWYDVVLNRLYIPASSGLVIVDVSQYKPTVMATIPVPAFNLLNMAAVPATPIAVTSLPDASRAYVASVPSSPDMSLPTQATISSVSGDGSNATYTYTLTAGHDFTAGVTITVTGTGQTGFDGTFPVSNVLAGTMACPTTCFQVSNTTVLSATAVSASATGQNIFPQVTVVSTTSNSAKSTIAIPGFIAYDAFCATTRFRMMMAAGGDSSRAYLSSCDGGMVNIIDTTSDTYAMNLPAPNSARPPIPPSQQNPPQNPVYMIAGP